MTNYNGNGKHSGHGAFERLVREGELSIGDAVVVHQTQTTSGAGFDAVTYTICNERYLECEKQGRVLASKVLRRNWYVPEA